MKQPDAERDMARLREHLARAFFANSGDVPFRIEAKKNVIGHSATY